MHSKSKELPKTIKPISIPSNSKPQHELKVKCINAKKLIEYQQDHMLDDLNMDKKPQQFSEQVAPIPLLFNKKQNKEILTMPQFLELQYPPPFNGAQALKDDIIDPNPFGEFLLIKPLNKPQLPQPQEPQLQILSTSEIIPIVSECNTQNNTTINEINQQLQQLQDEQVNKFLNKFENEKVEQKVTEYIKLPLPQLLMLNNHFTAKQKDQYRVLSADQRKKVNQKHDQSKQNLQQQNTKLSSEQLVKEMEAKKQDYFKIISELDMLKKGARQLKNRTSQQHQLRQKVDEPNIDKLLKVVKNTIWYTGDLTEGFDREMQLIQAKNIERPVDINNIIDNYSEIDEAQIVKQQTILQLQNSQLSKASIQSKQTQASKKDIPIKVSAKAQQMNDILNDVEF